MIVRYTPCTVARRSSFPIPPPARAPHESATWLRVIEIHSANGQIGKCEQDQVLEDDDALPGFSVRVAEVFAGL